MNDEARTFSGVLRAFFAGVFVWLLLGGNAVLAAPVECANVVTKNSVVALLRMIEGGTATAVQCNVGGQRYELETGVVQQAVQQLFQGTIFESGSTPASPPGQGVRVQLTTEISIGYSFAECAVIGGSNSCYTTTRLFAEGSTGVSGYPGDGGISYAQWLVRFDNPSRLSWLVDNEVTASNPLVGRVAELWVTDSARGRCPNNVCPGDSYNSGGGSGGSGGSGGGSGGGLTDRNDAETNCSIFDIPCNLKKLFIPRSSFIQEKLQQQALNQQFFTVEVKDKIDFGVINFPEPLSVSVPLQWDFSQIQIPQIVKDVWGLMVFWGLFLGLMRFAKIPVFSGHAKDDDDN